MKTLTYYASDTLRDAIAEHVVDTVLTGWDYRSVPAKMFAWVRSERAIEPQNPHEFELLEHPYSQRFQESAFEPITNPLEPSIGSWAVELARIVVPEGHVGFLVSIDQTLNDADGNYYPSNSAYWGSPNFVMPDVDNCRWYLKLDYFHGPQPPRFNYPAPGPLFQISSLLPGYPYSELYEIRGLWYPAHNNVSLKLIIPGRRMLRFYFYTPPTTLYRWQVSGRLRAYTQITYSKAAATNARLFC